MSGTRTVKKLTKTVSIDKSELEELVLVRGGEEKIVQTELVDFNLISIIQSAFCCDPSAQLIFLHPYIFQATD